MDDDCEPWHELRRIAVDSVAEGRLPPEVVLPGVRALDLWSDGVFGSVLFWAEPEAAQDSGGRSELGVIVVTCADGPWRSMGSARGGTEKPWADFLANVTPGLTRCGDGMSGSRDPDRTTWHKVCLTWVTAGSDVAVVRLRDQDGNARDRRPGRHGFVLLGITPEDPLTSAYAIGHHGEELPGEPLTLWCSPYDTSYPR